MPLPSPAIIAVGHYFPERILTNAELADRLGKSERWILERSGIVTRRVAATESTSDLIVPAALACLRAAHRDARDLDAVLVATVTPDHSFPSTAAVVQHQLGAARAWAMDIGASSSGFVFVLAQARALIVSGQALDCCSPASAPGMLRAVLTYAGWFGSRDYLREFPIRAAS